MADSSIDVQEPGTVTKRVDTEALTVGAQTVQRERVQVAGAVAAEVAKVANAAPGASDYGLVVREAGTVQVAGTVAVSSGAVSVSSGTVVVSSANVFVTNSPFPTVFATPVAPTLASTRMVLATSGDNVVVTGVAGQAIRIFQLFFVVASAAEVMLRDSSVASPGYTGAMPFGANGSMVLDLNGEPWFTTPASAGFIVNLSVPAPVRGRVYWTQS